MSGLVDLRDYITPQQSTPLGRRPIFVSPFTQEGIIEELSVWDNGFGSTTWTANLIVYCPIVLNEPTVVTQFWWDNGPTVIRGFSDLGIYDFAGNKLISTGATLNMVKGSADTANVTQCQVVQVPRYLLQPDRYWIAYGCDNSVHTINRANPTTQSLELIGVKQQASGWTQGASYAQTILPGPPEQPTAAGPTTDPYGVNWEFSADEEFTSSMPGLPPIAALNVPTVAMLPIFGFGGLTVS